MQSQLDSQRDDLSPWLHHGLIPTLAEYLRDLVEAVLDEVAVLDAFDADLDRFRDT
jgi:hypothetical protein